MSQLLPPSAAPSETALAKAIRDALERLGAMVIRVQSGTVRGRTGSFVHLAPKGCPDWLVVYGRALMLEIKRPGQKAKPEQVEFHARLRERGLPVYVVSSVQEAVDAVMGGAK